MNPGEDGERSDQSRRSGSIEGREPDDRGELVEEGLPKEGALHRCDEIGLVDRGGRNAQSGRVLNSECVTVQKFKSLAASRIHSSTPLLDVEVLLQWVLGVDRTRLLMERDRILTSGELKQLNEAVERREQGFPIAYITGIKEFFGYNFYVNPSVLIPKPDTEILVENALNALVDKQRAHPHQIIQILDMCSGSGCVGISLFKAFTEGAEDAAGETTPRLHFADISAAALEVTKKNARSLIDERHLDRLSFVQTNLFEQISFKYDIIVTNPPYVPGFEARELLKDGRSEPLLALDGDVNEDGSASGTKDGLALIRRLIPQAVAHLNPQGALFMETGEYNADDTAVLFEGAGLKDVRIEFDLSGQKRVVAGRL